MNATKFPGKDLSLWGCYVEKKFKCMHFVDLRCFPIEINEARGSGLNFNKGGVGIYALSPNVVCLYYPMCKDQFYRLISRELVIFTMNANIH